MRACARVCVYCVLREGFTLQSQCDREETDFQRKREAKKNALQRKKKTAVFTPGRKTISSHISLFCDETRLRRERGGEVFRVVIIQTLFMSGVSTRAQKRRMGERDLWGLIVINDDICFQHILPRLNATDIKFLY